MWQLTWMLSLIPDWVWFAILIIGVLGILAAWVLKFIPVVNTYRLPIQVLSILFLLVGVYFQGVIANEEKYKAEHERLQGVIAKAEEDAKRANEDLIATQGQLRESQNKKAGEKIKYIDKIIKGNTVEITKDMSDKERADWQRKVDELQRVQKECQFPELLVDQLNDMAKKPVKENKK